MTIHDLVEHLKAFPSETPVYIEGFEGGLEDLVRRNIRQSPVSRHVLTYPTYGPHEEDWLGGEPSPGLILGRDS